MIDDMNTLPPDDTTPSMHILVRLVPSMYRCTQPAPEAEECAICYKRSKKRAKRLDPKFLLVSVTKSSRKSEAMQGTWPEGSGRRGKKGQPRREVELPQKVTLRRAGRKCKADGSAEGHLDVLDPSSNYLIVTPTGRNDEAFCRFIMLL